MGIEQLSEKNSIENKKEALLANAAFVKLANGFNIYQDLLHDEKKQDQREEIKQRMLDLWPIDLRDENEDDNTERAVFREEIIDLINFAFNECENNSYKLELFAEKLASLSAADLLLEEWTGRAGKIKRTEKGDIIYVHVNEITTYSSVNDGEISIEIRPTGAGGDGFVGEFHGGLNIIAQKLKDGEIKADRIAMVSWLFSNEKIMKKLLGEGITLGDDSSEEGKGSQRLALQYNNKTLKKYLETGEKPGVKRVTLAKDEFIERFLK